MAIPATFYRWAMGILLGLGCITGPAAAQTQLLARQSLPAPKNQQGVMRPVVRVSAGITDDEKLGLSAELGLLLHQKEKAVVIQGLETGISVVAMPPPCPTDERERPCPEGHGSDTIAHLMGSIRLMLVGPLSLRAGLGGGAAFGGAGESDDDNALAAEKRTAPTLAYGVATDIAITPRLSVFVQYRGFSIFTGERTFSRPDESIPRDIGTEYKHLISFGISIHP